MRCILSRKLMILVDFITKIFGKYFIVALKEKNYFLDFNSQVFFIFGLPESSFFSAKN